MAKARSPIEVTLAGMVIAASPEPMNALAPMVANAASVSLEPLSSMTRVRPEMFAKASLPIEVVLSGIVTSVIPVDLNAPVPIISSWESAAKDTRTRSARSANASLPIEVTLAGIVISVIPVPLNALSPTDESTEFGSKVTSVSPDTSKNA